MNEAYAIIAKLNALHKTREQMQYASLYQFAYEAEAIRLNTRLKELTGKDYVNFPINPDYSRKFSA